ncbi:MAG: TraC family protein [Patescibacteria group bacterium]
MSVFGSPSAKDTVRQRKKGTLSSTQRFLPIAEIHHDTVVLKNGGLRAVLAVEALNFNLKSETEQQGIIAGYQSFMNTLVFPLQIVVRSSKMNIDPYLEHLRSLAGDQKNTLLRKQTLGYADFIEKLVDVADIMQKRFLVVVPVDVNPRQKTLLEQFFGWMSPDDSTANIAQRHRDFAGAQTTLKDRVNLVEGGLQNIGLVSRRLTTKELIELFYEIYNPKTNQEQKLPREGQMKVDKTVL